MLAFLKQKSSINRAKYMYPKARAFVKVSIISITTLSALSTVALMLIHHFGPENVAEYLDEHILELVINYATLFLNVVLTKLCISIIMLISAVFYFMDAIGIESLVSLLIVIPGTVVYIENNISNLMGHKPYIDSTEILKRLDVGIPNAYLLALHSLVYVAWISVIFVKLFCRKKPVIDPQHPKKTDVEQKGDDEKEIFDSGVNMDPGYYETISTKDGKQINTLPKKGDSPSVPIVQHQPSMPLVQQVDKKQPSTGNITNRRRSTVRPSEKVLHNQVKKPSFTPSSFNFTPSVDTTSQNVYAPKTSFGSPIVTRTTPPLKDRRKETSQMEKQSEDVIVDGTTHEPTNEVTDLLANLSLNNPVQPSGNPTIHPYTSMPPTSKPTEIPSNVHPTSSNNSTETNLNKDYLLRQEAIDLSSNVEFLQSLLNTPTFIPFGDTSRAISFSSTNVLKLWDIEHGELLCEMPGHQSTISSIHIYDHNRFFVSSSWDKTLKIWDLETGRLKDTLTGFPSELTCVIVFGEGKRIITGSIDGYIQIWDTLTSKFIQSMKANSHVSAIRVTRDNKKFLAACFDNTISLWNISTGESERVFEGHKKRVFSIELLHDNRYFISASEDHTLKLWEVDTGRCLKTFEGHHGSVQVVCLCNNDTHIVSGSEDGTLKVWEVSTGECIKTLDSHSGSIISCVCFEEWNKLVSYAMDKTMIWWDTSSFESISSKTLSTGSDNRDRHVNLDLRIIVATDDQEALENAQSILTQLGYTHFTLCQELDSVKAHLHPNHSFNVVFFDVSLFGSEGIDESIFTQPNNEQNLYVVILKSNEYWFLDVNEIFNNVPCMLDVIHKPITGLVMDKALREVDDLVSQRRKVPKIGSRTSSINDLLKSKTVSQDQSFETNDTLKSQLRVVESKFRSFVAHQFFDIITPRGSDTLKLGDAVCRSVTVMFSDIRDFSSISENMSVSELMEFINCYYAFAIPPIMEHGGFVDKFVGDSIMCLFAQQSADEQSIAAVNCAVSILKNLDFMKKNGFMGVETGIGINTGRSILGLVGAETRMEPTVLGDAVNLASRLESLCKVYHSRIVITEYTKEKMGRGADLFIIRELDYVAVKGKKIACRIFEVIDGDPPEIKQYKKNLIEQGDWQNALTKYQSGDFVEAKYLFEKCLSIYPYDQPSKIYIERCKSFINEYSDFKLDDWNPIHRLDNK